MMCHDHSVCVKWCTMITLSVWNDVPYSPTVCVKLRTIFTQCLVKSHPIFTQCLCEMICHIHQVSVWNYVPCSLSVCVKWCVIFTQCLCEICAMFTQCCVNLCAIFSDHVKLCAIFTQCLCEIMCHIHSGSVKLYHERLGIVVCVSNWGKTCDLLQWFVNKLEKLVISTLDCSWLVARVVKKCGGGERWGWGGRGELVVHHDDLWTFDELEQTCAACMLVTEREREREKSVWSTMMICEQLEQLENSCDRPRLCTWLCVHW